MTGHLTRDTEVSATTRNWLERAVVGLNLCPFAKAVHVKGQIRYVVSQAQTEDALLDDLERELKLLAEAAPEDVDTTLLIMPDVLNEFDCFVLFLDLVEVVLRSYGLTGILQVASFHPDYVFADAEPDDLANYTNRAPYPILHLLREASLAKATAALPDAKDIYERNIETLHKLGLEGWRKLDVDAPEKKPALKVAELS
ncbi:MAG: DUF1415 domain-containing protein [Proteobacteria bacterium]|nr:DUF1415 domain-containing protein [Pseudomonadota bacterium]